MNSFKSFSREKCIENVHSPMEVNEYELICTEQRRVLTITND